jgi:hypothetical protein
MHAHTGVDVRALRQNPGAPSERDDAILPPLALCVRQADGLLVRGQLQGGVQHVRRQWHSLQPREPPPRVHSVYLLYQHKSTNTDAVDASARPLSRARSRALLLPSNAASRCCCRCCCRVLLCMCVRILLSVCAHATMCVFILQYMCPHTPMYVSSYCCMCNLDATRDWGHTTNMSSY